MKRSISKIFMRAALVAAPLCISLSSCSSDSDSNNDTTPAQQSSVIVSTLAGSGAASTNDGVGSAAGFFGPCGITVNASGILYVLDYGGIRKVTPAGAVTTFVNSSSIGLNSSYGIAADASGNLYVANTNYHRISKVTPTGTVTTFAGIGTAGNADGTGITARFTFPYGIVIDKSDNLYVADTGNGLIRKVTSTGVVSTFAGSTAGYADGTGTAAKFNAPKGIAIDASNNLYVTDNNRIRKITSTGVVTTLAGDGTQSYADGKGSAAKFNDPEGVAVDASGNIYVADYGNHCIRKVTSAGAVTTLAGMINTYGAVGGSDGCIPGNADGAGNVAMFLSPQGIAIDASGNLYVTDYLGQSIRKITFN